MSFGLEEGKLKSTYLEHGPISVETAIFYRKTWFVSFFVYRRKSRFHVHVHKNRFFVVKTQIGIYLLH